jgi:hypothetical protein
MSTMNPRDSASSDDSFADPAGAFQALKRRALKNYRHNRRFDDDDLSDVTMSQLGILDMSVGQEEISDDSPAAAFQARKRVALKKYGQKDHPDHPMLFDDDLTETSTNSGSPSSGESIFSNNKKTRPSSVRFTTVSIRSFDRANGDNPCCIEAPAFALDWEYEQQPDISVETYETTRKLRKK